MNKLLRTGMLLCSFLLASVGWVKAQSESGGSSLITHETVGGYNYVYANGNTVTVSAKTDDTSKTIIATTNAEGSIEVDGAKTYLFGGSKDATVQSTNITMESGTLSRIYGGGNATTQEASVLGNVTISMSGGKVAYLFGGGYGQYFIPENSQRYGYSANVNGETNISVTGGTISGILAAGGQYYAKSGEVNMTISGSETSLNWVLGGGYDAGNTTNVLMTDFDHSVNGTSKTTISITNASAQYICAGGGQGYSYSKEVEATLNGVKILGGLLGTGSNGRSDKVIVKASNCDFTPTVSYTKEIAAINRGFVTDSVKMEFENCKFPTTDLAVYACATLAWQDGSYPIPTTPKTVMEFSGCEDTPTVGISEGLQDFVLTGADAKIAPFTRNSTNIITAFEILSDKTWTFNNGLTIDNGVTLTKNGTLNIGVSSVEQLKAAIAAGADKVTMAAGEYDLTGQLTINHTMTLEGTFTGSDSTRLVRTTAWTGTTNSNKHMIGVQANNVELKNLIVDAKGTSSGASTEGSGIQAYNATGVKLTNVVARNTKAAGVIVNSSTVKADYLHTEGNAWGGVNTDRKTTGVPSFTFTNSTFDERPRQVWAEEANGSSVVLAPNGWRTLHENGFYIWTSDNMTKEDVDGVTYVYANGYAVTVSANGADQTDITSGSQTLTFNKTDKVYLFGGSKDASVPNTSITMNGGSLTRVYGGGYKGNAGTTNVSVTGGIITSYLVGGGYGTKGASADVTTKATLVISNATIYYLVAGGYEYAKVEETTVTSNNSTYTWVLGGGFAPNGSGNNLDTEYANNANNVAKSTLNITGGQINGALCAGGGFSYAYVKTATTTLDGVTINGGLYGAGWNGRTETATVNVNGCTFIHKAGQDYRTTAAMIRGRILTSLNMVFDDKCSFKDGYEVYLGADRDNEYNPAPYAENATFEFKGSSLPIVKVSEGMHNVTVTGAPVIMDPFERQTSSKTWVKDFEIGSGKIWTFKSGLELTSDVTLNNNGSLSVGGVCKVATDAQLATVLGEKASVSNIVLAQGNYDGFTVSKDKVTISGNQQATITGTVTVSGSDVVLKEAILTPPTDAYAVDVKENGSLTVSHNYWGETPNFATLIGGKANPYPYYSDAAMTKESLVYNTLVINNAQTLTSVYEGCDVTITKDGYLTLNGEGLRFGKITIEEGGQLKPLNGTTASTAEKIVFKSTLKTDAWKALGTPFTSSVLNSDDEAVTLAAQEDDGVWFASLKDNKTPEIKVKESAETNNAGLWAAYGGGEYQFASTGQVELKDNQGNLPGLADDEKLKMIVNQNTYKVTLSGKAIYVFNASTNTFDRKDASATVTIAPFESFVIADIETAATLRSIGTTDPNATGNEFVVKEGYYLTTERGAIVVHTAEPMELYVVAVSGAVVYRGTVADGERIAVPTGFYAVNGQMVRVK